MKKVISFLIIGALISPTIEAGSRAESHRRKAEAEAAAAQKAAEESIAAGGAGDLRELAKAEAAIARADAIKIADPSVEAGKAKARAAISKAKAQAGRIKEIEDMPAIGDLYAETKAVAYGEAGTAIGPAFARYLMNNTPDTRPQALAEVERNMRARGYARDAASFNNDKLRELYRLFMSTGKNPETTVDVELKYTKK